MKGIVLTATMMVLAACGFSSHLGNTNLTPETVAKLERGKTTKDQAVMILGAPQSTRTQSLPTYADTAVKMPAQLTATDIWSYWSSNTRGTTVVLPFVASTSMTQSSYIVTLYFNKFGVMVDYQTMDTRY